jgi:hypothetical protein
MACAVNLLRQSNVAYGIKIMFDAFVMFVEMEELHPRKGHRKMHLSDELQ